MSESLSAAVLAIVQRYVARFPVRQVSSTANSSDDAFENACRAWCRALTRLVIGSRLSSHPRAFVSNAFAPSPSAGRRDAWMGGGSVEEPSKLDGQVVRQTRLDEKGRASLPIGPFACGWLTVTGHDHNGDVPCSGIAFQISNEIPAVSSWER
jgi:hypothetical protein